MLQLLRHYPARILLGACVVAAGTASTYLNIYLPTYVHKHLHVAVSGSYAVTFVASATPLLITPFAAITSDRTGRLPIMIWMVALLGTAAIPLMSLVIAAPNPGSLSLVFVLLTALRAAYTAPVAALLAELFPVEVRSAGMSMSYTLGVVAFGGFAQLAMEWLIGATGLLIVPGLYLAVTSAISLTALLAIRRRIALRL